MFLRCRKNRVGAAVFAAALTMALAAPAGAAPRDGFGETREITSGFLPRVLVWLGLSPLPGADVKCDGGSQIDPNGCPKGIGTALPASGRGGMLMDDGQRAVAAHRR